MEALLYTGFGISLFCLGLGTGAILESKMFSSRQRHHAQHEEIVTKVDRVEPLLISLADQLKRDYINYTPFDLPVQDPDQTMEIPEIRGSNGEEKETW